MTDQALLRISFGIASLVFELVLFIMLKVQGHGRKDNNMKFQTLVILVIAGNAASIVDNLVRVSEHIYTSQAFRVFVQLCVLILNVFLTYYVFLYIGTFVKNIEKRPWRPVNRAIIAGSVIYAIILQLLDRRGLLLNYFGAVIGSYIFYIGVEIPDHRNLIKSVHIVQTLAEAIDAKDTYTHGHSSRVAEYSSEIAQHAGYSEPAQNEIYMMALLHDVSKIGVPDAVINKPGRLNDDEFEQIKAHPGKGSRILGSMPDLVKGARWHHERFDGRGYPDGLKGFDIPEEARIIAVADAYDAMTSNRSYRRGMAQSKVREQIETGKGTQFDPRFADIMIAMIDKDKEYRMREI